VNASAIWIKSIAAINEIIGARTFIAELKLNNEKGSPADAYGKDLLNLLQ
jgi:hypothetical protein